MCENIPCKICGNDEENIREYRATVRQLSCSKCGALLSETPFLLAAYQTKSGVVCNV